MPMFAGFVANFFIASPRLRIPAVNNSPPKIVAVFPPHEADVFW
jgi:hypothetical protein